MWHQSGSSEYMNWKKAKKWLKKVNMKGYAGYSDWRLPTVEEAVSLLESKTGKSNYFIDPIFAKKQWGMWTGDKNGWDIQRGTRAWVVTFINGTVNQSYINSASTYVRPVRLLQ